MSSEQYSDIYPTPVLTANQAFILGYTNEEHGIYNKGEVILFDDFTCDTKFANFPFKVKSSAMKLLRTKNGIPISYAYELLRYINYKPEGHARHWISIMQPLEVWLPQIDEQKKVGEFLAKITEKIDKQKSLIELLKKYKRGVSIAIFDRKISLTKSSPSWIKTTVGEICKITMGQSPDSESYNTDRIGIPLVQGNADMKNRITCPQRYTSKPTKICYEGSIILSVRAPVGSVGRADRTVCLGRGVCAINSENNGFLYYFFERNEPYWKRIEQGGTFTAISGDDISDMPINYPSQEERQKIADFLLKIDIHIAAEENTLNQLVAIKSGLLQQLFI